MIKILHITQSLPGGPASYFEEIAGYQSERFGETNVRFLVPGGYRAHIPSVRDSQIAEFLPAERSTRGLLALAAAARQEVAGFQPDIVHLHSTFAGGVVRSGLLLGVKRPSIVYCAHGWAFGMEVPPWKKRLYAAVERVLARSADRIVNISNTEHEAALAFGIPERKMIVIRNGIANREPAPPRAAAADDPIHLLFVGRLDRQKGIDHLLECFSRSGVDNVHLHIVGAHVVDKEETLRRQRNVTFHGWKDREGVSEMIGAVDALIVPSRWEGFGFVAVEAMRVGRPVIASRRGGLVEIVEHARTGLLFEIDRPAELIGILRSLDRKQLQLMGVAGRRRYEENFNSQRMNEELAALYADVASGAAKKKQAARRE